MPDGITYTTKGGYAELDAAALIAQFGGGFQGDPGGGPLPAMLATRPPAGYAGYRLAKLGKRWTVVDPLGKAMLVRGLYKASYDQNHVIGGGQQAGRKLITSAALKHAGVGKTTWDAWAARFMQHYHYNATASASRWLTGFGIAAQAQYNTGIYTLSGGFGVLSEAVKDIVRNGVRQNLPGQTWVGRHLIDAFDPKFTQYVDHPDPNGWGGITPNPDVLFYQADDGDYLFFFGSGHTEETGFAPGDSNWGPHGGIVALISAPTITGPITDPRGGTQRWVIDTRNHTKRALLDQLIAKYGTIANLNAAWNTGGYYTTFESAGGWGVGTGLADEDGLRPRAWFGKDGAPFYQKLAGQNDYFCSTRWAPNVKVDLDLFLGRMMDAYLKPFAERLQIRAPGALFIGHTGAGAGGLVRRPVLESYGRWLHLVRAGGDASDAVNRKAREWIGRDMPWMTALYYPNNDDGCLYYLPKKDGTQAARGAGIAAIKTRHLEFRDADGVYPVVGTNFWGMFDQPGEGIGWGHVTYSGNPYNGKDHTTPHPDEFAPDCTTLTEDRVYGDSLTPVKAAHVAQLALLKSQIAGTAPIPIPAPTPVPTPTPTPAPTPGGPMLVTATAEGTTLRVRVEGGPGHWQDQVSIHTTAAYDWPAAASQRTNGPTADLVFTLPPGTYYPRFYFNSQSAGERLSSAPASITLPAPVPVPVPEPTPVPPPTPSPTLEARVLALEEGLSKVRAALA